MRVGEGGRVAYGGEHTTEGTYTKVHACTRHAVHVCFICTVEPCPVCVKDRPRFGSCVRWRPLHLLWLTHHANSWGSAGGALVRHLHALVHVLAVQVPQQLGVRCGAACVVGVGPWSVVCGCKVGAACTGAGGFDFRERRELARGPRPDGTAMIALYCVCGLRLSRVVTAHAKACAKAVRERNNVK